MKSTLCILAVTGGIAASATAGPLLTINGSVGGFTPFTTTSNGASTAITGRYSYIGGMVNTFPNPAWAISWDLVGDDTSVNPNMAFITNGFRVQNLSGAAQTFDITVALASPGASNMTMDGLAVLGGSLTSDAASSTATLASLGATPMWSGQVNGISRTGALLLSNASYSTASTTNFSSPNGDWTGAVSGPLTSVGYRMQFTLGAKSTVLFSGYWDVVPVPAPSAAALLAVAGGFGIRRRRTN
jgi:hypothetical protein